MIGLRSMHLPQLPGGRQVPASAACTVQAAVTAGGGSGSSSDDRLSLTCAGQQRNQQRHRECQLHVCA